MPSFIIEHPEFIAWVIGGLLAIIGSLLGIFWGFIGHRLNKLEEVDGKLKDRVGAVEITLGEYKEHIGAGDKILRELATRIDRHMTEEEDQVWGGMDALKEQLTQMLLENQKAHAEIITSFTPRLATLEVTVARIERGMPNGELKEALGILRELKGKL